MKAKSIIKLLLTFLVIGGLVFLTLAGIKIGKWQLQPAKDSVRLGLDISGGVHLEYQAKKDTGAADAEPELLYEISDEEKDSTISSLRARADSQGYTAANIYYNGNGRFVVEIPNIENADEASKMFGTIGKLTFTDPEGKEIITGEDVKEAVAKYGQTSETGGNGHYVALTLSDEGLTKFSDATGRLIGSYISINLDGMPYSQPTVQTRIDSDPIITIGAAEDASQQARDLAGIIRSGQLPFGLQEVGSSTVSATLGQNALMGSLWAGLISLLLIIIYMIFFYRLPGLVSGVALIFYAVLTVLLLGVFKVNLTLPGIAGIVVSMGMAVDANVVIFERLTDEMKNGKTLRASVDAGYNRALTAVVDSNVTTLISAGVLWWLGSGTVKGFAITLFLGVIVSMFTAIFVTKFVLQQVINLNIKNRKLYGIGIK